MDDAVTAAHIGLYVNDFTINLGREGREAVDHLLEVAERENIIPASAQP